MYRLMVVMLAVAVRVVGADGNCSCAAATPCKYDPSCANGGLGCDADGQKLCRFCGFGAYAKIPCDSPTPTPPTPPTPTPQPTPPTPPAPTPVPGNSSCFRGGAEVGVALSKQKALAAQHWAYKWGPAPYGHPQDIAGVLQIVNGGSQPMWVRYGGNGISPGDDYDWKPFITNASALNGGRAHAWNALNAHGMGGQGDGFKLAPGEVRLDILQPPSPPPPPRASTWTCRPL